MTKREHMGEASGCSVTGAVEHNISNRNTSTILSFKSISIMDAIGISNAFFVVIEFIVCFLGTPFNGLVIFTICKNKHRLSAPSYLILSIAVSDFLSCLVAVPFSIAGHFQKRWPFGMIGCQAHAFMIFLLGLVSITHLTIISAEKYLTITRSISRHSYCGKKQVLVVIMASWIYSFGFSVAPLLGWSRYGLEGTNDTCSIKWESSLPEDHAYFGIMFFACYFLPMAVILFCYYKIHEVSKSVVVNTSQMGAFAVTMTQALLKKHRKSAMYFLIVIASYLLAWTPYAVVSLLTISRIKINSIATSGCGVFAKTSFLLNPVMYTAFSRKFRRLMVRSIPAFRENRLISPGVFLRNSETMLAH